MARPRPEEREATRRRHPSLRNALLAAFAILLLWFAWEVRAVLNPLIAAYFLAFCVHPFVVKLERRGWSRERAVNMIFLAAGAAVLLTAAVAFVQARKLVMNAGPLLARAGASVDRLLAENPESVAWMLELLRLGEEAVPNGATVEEGGGAPGAVDDPARAAETEAPPEELSWSQLLGRIGERLFRGERAAQAGKVGLQAAESGWAALRSAFGTGFAFLSFLFLLPIYTWFLLFELGRIHVFVRRYIPRHERERVTRVGRQIGEVLTSFFRGRLLVCLLKGLVLFLGLWIASVDYALLLGLGGGVLSLVPFIGPLFTFFIAFLVALADPTHSVLFDLGATGFVFLLAEFVEGYILIPRILGNSLGLHPVVVLVAVFVGGAALGMFGLLIAIPLTAALIILAREFLLPVLAELADEGGPPGESDVEMAHDPLAARPLGQKTLERL